MTTPHSGGGPVERPAPPKPPRFNRNALTIAAVMMGVIVIAAIVLLTPTRSTEPAGAARAPDAPATTYLDQRPRPRVAVDPLFADTALDPASAAGAIDTAALRARMQREAAGSVPYVPPYDEARLYGEPVQTVPAAPTVVAAPREPTAERRRVAYAAALEAPLTAVADQPAEPEVRSVADPGPVDFLGFPEADRAASAAHLPPSPVSAGDSRRASASPAEGRDVPATVRTSVDPVPGPYAVQAGTVIPAVLLTEINSDLPGECLAQVARDVYDTPTQRAVLIPKGAKLLCRYDDQVSTGQSRILVAWTRVLLPDGRSISLPGLPGTDARGARGVSDQVDRHVGRAFGTAGLLSLVGAGLQLSQPQQGAFSGASPGQVAAGAVGQELAQVATQLLQRDLAVQPTIRIRQGTAVNVFVNADLTFPGPYVAQR